jgi:hypothetical protein
MSLTSQYRQHQKNAAAVEAAQEATAARHRIRAVDIEQSEKTLKAFDVGSYQHVANVFRKRGCLPDGTKKETAFDRARRRRAFQLQRKASVVRRTARPVVASRDKTYATLSNGQRVKLGHRLDVGKAPNAV